MPSALTALHALRRLAWRTLRPATRGVKVLVTNARGEVLLIRNSYGDTRSFVLPGGGVRPLETPEAAARREVWEELRCRLTDLILIATFTSTREAKRDTIHLFRARTDDAPPQAPASREIAEAAFHDPAAPPSETSPATRRRLAEHLGQAERPANW